MVSFNRPHLPANASWNANGATLTGSTSIGNQSFGLFVDTYNTVYSADRTNNCVWVWMSGSSTPTRNISGGFSNSESLFVSTNGYVYVDNGGVGRCVNQWSPSGAFGYRVMNVTNTCSGLFIDINNTLYCSMFLENQVIKTSLSPSIYQNVVAAGHSTPGSASNMLHGPVGIFVDINFDLYVADSFNNRVQKFSFGRVNGTTVIGNGSMVSGSLNFPRSVVLDADGNLFVSDSGNARIVMLGPNGFRCIAACHTGPASSSYSLNEPGGIAFDSFGNIFVADTSNNRIQMFLLLSNSLGKLSIRWRFLM